MNGTTDDTTHNRPGLMSAPVSVKPRIFALKVTTLDVISLQIVVRRNIKWEYDGNGTV